MDKFSAQFELQGEGAQPAANTSNRAAKLEVEELGEPSHIRSLIARRSAGGPHWLSAQPEL